MVALLVRPYPRWNDGIFVLNDASSFPDVPLDHHALRIGNLLPTRLFLDLFGYGQVAYYAWPFLTGILLVVATLALGNVLFGRWVGASAALLMVFHPVLVDTEIRPGVERMTSWQLLPDIPSAAFLTLGFALMIGAAQRRSPDGTDHDGGPTWWYVVAGLCFGWAYLVRELSVFVFPVIVGVLIGWRLPLRRWAAGRCCPCSPAWSWSWSWPSPCTATHWPGCTSVSSTAASRGPSCPRVDALMRLPRAIVAYPQTTVVLASVVLTIVGAVLLRRRGHVLMLGWFVSVWLPLSLASGLVDPDYIRINASLMRYWIPVLPPLCIGAAAAVAALLAAVRRRAPTGAQRRVALGCALVALAALAVWCVPLGDDIADNPRDAIWNSMRAELDRVDDQVDTVIADDRDRAHPGRLPARADRRRPRLAGGHRGGAAQPGAVTGTGRGRHVPALDAAALAASHLARTRAGPWSPRQPGLRLYAPSGAQ